MSELERAARQCTAYLPEPSRLWSAKGELPERKLPWPTGARTIIAVSVTLYAVIAVLVGL